MMLSLCKGEGYILSSPIDRAWHMYLKASRGFIACVVFVCFQFVCLAHGQSGKVLQGVVSSAADDQPLQGVTITVEDSYTITNEKGEYIIRVNSDSGKLTVNHIGYNPIGVSFYKSTASLNIQLKPVENQIGEVEVVSTGYQQIPKERATGSFELLSNEEINKMQSFNILDRLDGVIPGLQFDNRTDESKIHIRGINSFSDGSASRPLIILDNFPYEGDLANINPNDVESVSILKDAAATSIWGVRAGNGVIVITLKKPKELDKININYSSNLAYMGKPNIYYHQPMNSGDFIDVERFLYEKGHYGDMNGARARTLVFSPVVTMLDAIDRGLMPKSHLDDSVVKWKNLDYRDEVYKYFLQSTFNQQHSLSLSQKNSNNFFRIALGFDDNRGGNSRREQKRYTLRSSNSFSFKERFTIDANLSASISDSRQSYAPVHYPITPGGGKAELYPYARLLDDAGNALPIPKDYFMSYIDTVGGGQLLDWYFRPYDDIDKSYGKNQNQHLGMDVSFKAKLFEGIQGSLDYSFEKQNSSTEILRGEESYYARNLVNRFTQVTPTGLKYNIPIGGVLSNSNTDMISNRIRGQVSLDKKVLDVLDVNAIVGAELSDLQDNSNSYGSYGFDEGTYTVTNVNYVDAFPIYDGLGGAGRISAFDAVNGVIRRFASFYFNSSFTYQGKYIASFSARKDATNTFGVKTNERWNPLWSAGAAWNIKRERFMENIELLNTLRLRVTMGHSGNIAGGTSDRPILYHMPAVQQHTNLPYALINVPPNPHLKWENVFMQNYAVESTFLDHKYRFTFEYYTKHVSDLISSDPMDPTSGYASMQRNVGEIKSKGFDTQLKANWIHNRSFSWDTRLGLSYIKDIVKVYKGVERTADNYRGGKSLTPLENRVFYPLFSYPFHGLDPENGNPLGYLNGELSDDYTNVNRDSLKNVNYHGSTLPHWYGHFQNTITYKGLSLYFNITYKWGHYFLKPTIGYADLFNSWSTHSDFEKRWQTPGDELSTTIPSMVYPANTARDAFYRNSSPNVEKGDHIRLKTVRLSYNLPLNPNRSYIKNIQIYGNANNLGLLWSATDSGIDADYSGLPPSRDFNFGITCQF